MVDILECPICKTKDLQKLVSCTDHTVSHETFQVKLCPGCTLAITTPRPDINKLGDYYKSEEYISHSGKSSGGIGFLYRFARSLSLRWKRSKIQNFSRSGSILDFGCGTGEFLNFMKKSGWNIDGLEVSDYARQKAEILNSQSFRKSLDEISGKQFDVISAWHVIEHVPDLAETVARLKSHLKKSGTLFIAVPNYESPDATYYQEYWAGYDVPRHLWHFSKKSMEQLLRSCGLKLITIAPMKLDAYYVSMLSEKYKNKSLLGLSQMILGFLSGIKSNVRANTKTNHSSLIYIAKVNEG